MDRLESPRRPAAFRAPIPARAAPSPCCGPARCCAPRLGLCQCRTAHRLHAAHAVPPVLHHQAVHLRRGAGRLPDPTVLDAAVRARLPLLVGGARRAAPVPQPVRPARLLGGGDAAWLAGRVAFGDAEARGSSPAPPPCISRRGRGYSYVNQNFRLLSDVLQDHTGRSFAELLRSRISIASAWAAPSSPPIPAPCPTAPRAMRALATASAPRRTASSGPAMPGSAPASTT